MTLSLGVLIHVALQFMTALRALTRRNRLPSSRAAWLFLVLALPVVGIALYFLFGETNVGAHTRRAMTEATRRLGKPHPQHMPAPGLPPLLGPIFARAAAVNGFVPVGGNEARLADDENAAVDALVADIDAARHSVHLLFYIWLSDRNGRRVIEAVERAAARGVTCRLLIDGLGSKRMAASRLWRGLRKKGVHTAITFKMRWLLIHIFFARIDLRNHRKIAVIDGRIGHVGSQNCADPEFRVKRRYAPWVDIMLRIEGPVVAQLQHLFAVDWMTHDGEDISALLDDPVAASPGGFTAIAVGTGPTIDSRAVSDLFSMLILAATKEAIITTPYYVPDDTLQRALCGAALRGVKVTLIVPARNDSLFVARASRSYYADLLWSGVRIAEYRKGLLHAKTVTIDGIAACLGSANMDRRSFELNYENNIILHSPEVAGAVRARQEAYMADSDFVDLERVRATPLLPRAVNNLFATMGPLL